MIPTRDVAKLLEYLAPMVSTNLVQEVLNCILQNRPYYRGGELQSAFRDWARKNAASLEEHQTPKQTLAAVAELLQQLNDGPPLNLLFGADSLPTIAGIEALLKNIKDGAEAR